jgi:hypothetical protein
MDLAKFEKNWTGPIAFADDGRVTLHCKSVRVSL